jgi:hypothetical protein
MPTFFAPKPGRFGVLPTILPSGRINTGTVSLPYTTTNHNIGSFSAKSYINRALVCAETFPRFTGTATATVQLFKMTGATALALTDALDIHNASGTARPSSVPVNLPILSSLTEAQRTLTTGDSLRIAVAFGGTAVTDQPDDLTINVELLVEE